MKRSSFLLAAGISLIAMSTASVSLAAPPAGGKKAKPVKTVKTKKEKEPPKKTTEETSAASSDSSTASPSADKAKGADDAKPGTNVAQGSTPSTTPGSDVAQDAPAQPTPAPAPADGSSTTPASGTGTDTTPTPTPTLTLTGPSTTPSDTPATAPTTPAAKPKPRPFAGSALYVTNSMTTGTVFRGQQQDYNPTVESNFWFLPRYALNKDFQIRNRTIVTYEYTNSDNTRYRNEPIISDTTFQLFYRGIPEILTIKPMVALNGALPLSKASRARTMVFSPGASFQLVKGFEHILPGKGDLQLISSAIYSHPIYQSRQPEVVDARPEGAVQCVGGVGDCNNVSAGGTLNPSDVLSYFFLVEAEWGKWSPALYYLGSSQWVYSPKDVTAGQIVPGGGDQVVTSGQSAGPPGVRQTHYFSAWLDYNFNSWITGEIGYWHSRTALNENGQRGNIFFDRYQDTRVYLGASIQIDNLVKTLQGGNEGEGGVVRAHNTKKPMWNF